jgi:GYF domain 2
MSDDPGVIDKGWDTLPGYSDKPNESEDAVTLSISTTPGEWLVNTTDSVVVPMSMLEVVDALRSRRLNERSLVWRAGMQEWAPVEKVPQLRLAARLPSVTPTPSQPLASGRQTLPFGVRVPSPSASRPTQPRPAPRVALPPPSGPEDAEVLAVYERPAATLSFELEEPPPTFTAPAPAQPQTLAPTTTDRLPSRPPAAPPRSADLSVVAARDFRQAQQFSRKLILASSVGSALVASLLTLWLSREGGQRAAATAPAPMQTLAAPSSPPPVAPPPVVSVAEPAVSAAAPPEPSTKPKPKRKARPWRAPAKAPAGDAAPANPETKDANPYDVQLEDDPPTAAPPSTAHGSGLEPDRVVRDEGAATSPGF